MKIYGKQDVKTWRFSEPSRRGDGWWIAFLDGAGALAIVSDYGDYSYRWNPAALGAPNLVRFLVDTDSDYVMRKISPREDHLDCDATEKRIREILAERGDGESLDFGISNELDLYAACVDHDLEGEEVGVYVRNPQAVAFMKRIWPRIIAHMKRAIAEGEA